jgi:GcrA cell cycle regulator
MNKNKAPKTIETLEADDCRWPVGDPRRADFHFCGEKKALGRPYCEGHWNLSLQSRSQQAAPVTPAEPSRRAA